MRDLAVGHLVLNLPSRMPIDRGVMKRSSRLRLELLAVVAAVVPVSSYGVLRLAARGVFFVPVVHFLAVVVAAMAAAMVSIWITRAAVARSDLRAGLTGVGFTLMAGLLVIHGLSTPGVILARDELYPVVGVTGALAVPLGGALMLLSVRARSAVHARGLIVTAQAVTLGLLGVLGAVSLVSPDVVRGLPTQVQPWMYVLLIPTVSLYGWMAWMAACTFRLTRRAPDLLAAVGMVWLGSSTPIYLTSPVWSVGFWIAHAVELLGFLAVAHAVVRDLSQVVPSFQLSRRVGSAELIESEHQLLGSHVRAMTASLHERDPSTATHSRRVAQLAMIVADQLRLSPSALRRVAIAGLVHDIGKLAIPAQILTKPGRLTDEEYDIIKTHPQTGANILATARGFDAEIPIVLAHHERVDGAGYPHGLRADQIPLEARILAVCDVYDALTSKRAYRDAWPAQKALQLLIQDSGSAFDPTCVNALTRAIADTRLGDQLADVA
jgi:putative nucleotidyltransferase with HDIG domain